MSNAPIASLEQELSISLPAQYKSALFAHPFSAGSLGQEMLVSDTSWLLQRNRSKEHTALETHKHRLPSLSQGLFLIGTDGGELEYYLKVNASTSAVMQYNLETHELSEFAANFDNYLETIRKMDSAIHAEEALGEERALRVPAWRHTLNSYMPAAIALFFFFVVMPLIAFGIRSLYRWLMG